VAGSQYAIRHVTGDRADAVLAFYKAHRAYEEGHVWPRTLDELEQFARDERLLEAVDLTDGSTVGVCYIRRDENDGKPRWESGGLFFDPAHRGTDVPYTLVKVSIIALFVLDPPGDEPLMGHVHELNRKPRSLLERLGFEQNGEEKMPPHVAPASMQKNAQGEVIGHVFEFRLKALSAYADWLEGYTDSLEDGTPVILDVALYADYREATIKALRATAAGEPANT
jgi:RimJ/RimL family protein N-acetyltransferase